VKEVLHGPGEINFNPIWFRICFEGYERSNDVEGDVGVCEKMQHSGANSRPFFLS